VELEFAVTVAVVVTVVVTPLTVTVAADPDFADEVLVGTACKNIFVRLVDRASSMSPVDTANFADPVVSGHIETFWPQTQLALTPSHCRRSAIEEGAKVLQ
jgi:hypothetical protein